MLKPVFKTDFRSVVIFDFSKNPLVKEEIFTSLKYWSHKTSGSRQESRRKYVVEFNNIVAF